MNPRPGLPFILTLALALALICVVSVRAVSEYIKPSYTLSADGTTAILDAIVSDRTGEDLIAWLDAHAGEPLVLRLGVPGIKASTETIYRMAEAISKHDAGVRTVVPAGKICSGICALFWLAGDQREIELNSSIMIPGVSCGDTDECVALRARLNREYERYLVREAEIADFVRSTSALDLEEGEFLAVVHVDVSPSGTNGVVRKEGPQTLALVKRKGREDEAIALDRK